MNLNKLLSSFSRHLLFLPVLFLIANLILSDGYLPLVIRIAVAFFGIFLPLAGAYLEGKKKGSSAGLGPAWEWNSFPAWAMILLVLTALATRFYRLTDLNAWPTRDDGYFAIQAMDRAGRGLVPFFYGTGEMPPAFRWLLGPFLDRIGPSLFSLWLFPALLSLLSILVGFLAIRPFVPRVFAFVFGFLLAGSFWPILLGRFCNVWVLFFNWELFTIGALAAFILTKGPYRAIVAGICLGIGPYISPNHWIFFSAAAAWFLLIWVLQDNPRRWKDLSVLLLSALVVSFPAGLAALSQGYGRHVQEVHVVLGELLTPAHLSQMVLYLSGLFWGFENTGYNYGPVQGGFLNPLLGSFFFMGLVYFLKEKPVMALKAGVPVLLVLLSPGFLTRDLEMQRLLPLLPLLMVAAAVGLVFWVFRLPKPWAALSLAGVLLFSAGWDFYRLVIPLPKVLALPWDQRTLESEESSNAYSILKKKADQEGPGLIFLDYVSVPLDGTLFIASYPFNAVQNPKTGPSEPTWMAFLTNINYRPFLEKRFPRAEFCILGSHLMPWDGELMLVVTPIGPAERPAAAAWFKAQSLFHEATCGLQRLSEARSREGVLQDLLKGYGLVRGDPFLESAFWEIAYFNHSADQKFIDSAYDLSQILQKGYPAAHIYNELGSLLYFEKDVQNARKAFLKAYQLGGDHTLAKDNLQVMGD